MDSVGFNESGVSEKSPCGRYSRYMKILGRGAFKDVYEGFDSVSNMDIAWCQICFDDGVVDEEKLCSEAVLLKSLDHKNIMKCFCYWVDNKNYNMNMITELFSLGSLRRYYRQKSSNIDLPTIKNWGRQILQGLKYLHSQNPRIVHRDLKGDNIFLDTTTDEVKIGDFGLATFMQEGSLSSVVGTPEYMAPEYYDEEYTELVDIYAFGMCLLELATSECPYSECINAAQIFKKVTFGIKPLALGKVKEPEVKEIVERCLAPASDRPSAVELLKDPFFALEDQVQMEIDCNYEARLMTSSPTTPSAESCLSVEPTIADLKGSSLFSVEKQFCHSESNNHYRQEWSFTRSGDGNPQKVSRAPSTLYESSTSEVSMSSKVTFDSSFGELCSYPGFFISTLRLQSMKLY